MTVYNQTKSENTAARFGTTTLVISVVMLFVICFGNTLTIVAVWKTKKLQTVASMYIVSLAVIDTLIGVGQLIRSFMLMWAQHLLVENSYLCAFTLLFLPVLVVISGFCMVLIAVDRYIFILHPLKYQRLLTPKRAGIAIGAIWLTVPIVSAFNTNVDFQNACSYRTIYVNTYYLVVGVIVFVVISATIIVLYSRILTVAKRQIRSIHSSSFTETNAIVGPAKTWKLIRHFLVVFGVFFVCWLPTIMYTIGSYFGLQERRFMFASYVFILLNSSTNFLVYAWMDRAYREAFKNLLCCNKSNGSSDVTTITIPRTA